MNFPVEPNNPVFLLMQLLTVLSQGGPPLTEGARGRGGDLPASLKDASRLLFVPPDQKISFTPEQKIVPILRSFQKKLEKAIEAPAQKPDSEPSSKAKPPSETLPASKPREQRAEDQKSPRQPSSRREPLQSSSFIPAARPKDEMPELQQLIKEVKEALRSAGDKASIPQEAPRIKMAAEKLMPLLDRLLTALPRQKRAEESLAPLTAKRANIPALQATRERSFLSPQELSREPFSAKMPARIPSAKPLEESGFSKPAFSSATEEARLLPPLKNTPIAQEILRSAPFLPAAVVNAASHPRSNGETTRLHTDLDRAVFPVPYFAQPVLSSIGKRKKSREEEKEASEEEDEDSREESEFDRKETD